MKVKNSNIFMVNGKLVRMDFSDTDKTVGDYLTIFLKIYTGNCK